MTQVRVADKGRPMEHGVSEFVVSALPIQQPSLVAPNESDRWNMMFNSGNQALSGVKVNHRSTIGYPPFWRGVNLLANSVAGLPLDVFRRSGDDRVVATAHPAQKLIKRSASPILRARKFRKTLMGHALLFGNGFAWIERDERARPTALWVLDPQQMIVRYFEGQLWYSSVINGEQIRWPGRDIIHITGLTPNGIVGYSAIDIMADALGVGMAAQQFGARFFGDGANMSGLLMVPGHFQEEKIRNTLGAWKEMSQGMKNAHKVALLQDGVKFQQTTIPPDSAQFLQTRDFEVRVTVANILGVPPHLLGDDSRTSHNSLEQENQSYLNHSLNPWLNEWEGELEHKLLSDREQDRGTHFIEFNREAAVQMLFKEKVDGLYRQVEMGQLTVNESRKMINLPDIGEDGDKRYHPANWMEIGVEPPAPEAPAIVPMEEPEEDETDEDTDAPDALAALLASSVTEAISFEKRKVVTAASKQSNFCGWLDGFYESWCGSAVSCLTGPDVDAAKRLHAQVSKSQLLDIAGSSTVDTLAANVKEVVAKWDTRTTALVDSLRKAIR